MHLKMGSFRKFLIWIAFIATALTVIGIVIHTFTFVISGGSMQPTLKSYDYGIVNIFAKSFERKDVVVFRDPQYQRRYLIARIIGLPSELVEIRDGDVYINGEVLDETEYWSDESITHGDVSIRLKENEYYVLGDNRVTARDSRIFGAVQADTIRGEFNLLLRGW